MDNNTNFEVSEELRKILKTTNEIARKEGYSEISLELVTYVIFKSYIKDGFSESSTIKQILGTYKTSVKDKILDLCKTAYEDRTPRAKSSASEELPFTEEMEIAIKNSKVYDGITGIITDRKKNGIITTEILFIWGIMFSNSELISDLDDFFELNKYKFLALDMTNRIFDKKDETDLSDAVLKEKKIETPSKEENNNPVNSVNDNDDKFEKAAKSGALNVRKRDSNSKTPVLDQYGLDITKKAKEGGYDPVIGRSKEISQVIEILCCRKKNNAALLGDPGVGKTAIVEGLAQEIASGKVPEEIKGKRIFSISVTDLQAGTIYRGQLEERVQELCNEVRENKDVIVYIDEFHQAVSEGSSNIAQMLKPSLARGEMNMIISTTTSEYRRFIEKDAALKRRFEPVQIEEPDKEQTKEILKGISEQYSKFHHVKFTDEVISKCVDWAGQYITDRQFPDKAIGILDMSGSLTKLSKPLDYSKRDELQGAIDSLNKQADKAIEDSEFDRATKIREARLKVESELAELLKSFEDDNGSWPEVTIEMVSAVISKISGVPIDKIKSSTMGKLREMKDQLSSKVIGQDQAVEELTIALQRNILGLRDPRKPIASFLLVGPTGVGKTLVSKILASEFFGSEKSIITISCSEYMQDWAESKLLGSAPGYVGFSDSEPRLYELKRKPFCVLLIDEIEKSSSNLYNIWLNMLEEGEVTLSSGEKVSCRDCIIIFTGNVGTKSLELKSADIGFGTTTKEDRKKKDLATVMKEVNKEFRPEFLNRLSKIIVFNNLEKKELESIFDLELDKLQERLTDYKINVTKKLKSWIVDKTEPKYGARSLQRLIVEHIEQELCKFLLENDLDGKKKPVKVKFDLDKENDKVTVTV